MKTLKVHLFLVCLFYLVGCTAIELTKSSATRNNSQPEDWLRDWAIEEGFLIERDSIGYQLPTAIAFVPNPGIGAKDPLYFVTELYGTVKVITNDRSVFTFAENFYLLNDTERHIGLTGICLELKQGYVFVTFTYQQLAC